MSAFVVSRNHIRYLVSAAADRNLTEIQDYPLSWSWEGEMHTLPFDDRAEQTWLGQMLWAENVKSVSYRYRDDETSELPGVVEEAEGGFQYGDHKPWSSSPITPVQVLKACDCYEYQSCEHPEWKQSEAYAFIQALRERAIEALPGYDKAQWEIDEMETQKQPAR